MLIISWKDKVSNTDVMKRIREKEPQFYREIVRQKRAYAGHVLRGNGHINALVILAGKMKGKKAKGRLKKMWFDDIRQWTVLKRLWWPCGFYWLNLYPRPAVCIDTSFMIW